jgi:hypothetical protein
MPGLVPGIHVFAEFKQEKTWMAGTKPGHDEKWVMLKREPVNTECFFSQALGI